jgi:hypothetical protein
MTASIKSISSARSASPFHLLNDVHWTFWISVITKLPLVSVDVKGKEISRTVSVRLHQCELLILILFLVFASSDSVVTFVRPYESLNKVGVLSNSLKSTSPSIKIMIPNKNRLSNSWKARIQCATKCWLLPQETEVVQHFHCHVFDQWRPSKITD